MITEDSNNEKQYRVIISECGRPTQCYFVGTMEEYKDAVTNGIIKDGMIIVISTEK